jgi:hypothetical protein
VRLDLLVVNQLLHRVVFIAILFGDQRNERCSKGMAQKIIRLYFDCFKFFVNHTDMIFFVVHV